MTDAKRDKFIIFLDIDFVLNGTDTKECIGAIKGLDPGKLDLLKELVDYYDADIVLISTWRNFWNESLADDGVDNWKGRSEKRYGRYLNLKFEEHGLRIVDKTKNIFWAKRAEEVLDYIKDHNVKGFLILDDEDFRWEAYDLAERWICTSEIDGEVWQNGLERYHVELAKSHISRKE